MFTSSKVAVEGFSMIPNSNILWGHLALMMEDDFRVSVYKFSKEYADENGRVCFWMGTTAMLSVTKPSDVQHVLKHSSHRTFFAAMQKHVEAFLGTNNVGMLSGKKWKVQRAAIVKALHKTVNDKEAYGAAIRNATKVLVDSLLARLQDDDAMNQESSETPVLNEYNVGRFMKMLTFDCFGQTALHQDFGCCEALQLSQVAVSFEFLASEMMRRMTWGMLDPTSSLYGIPTPKNLQHAKHRKIVRDYIGTIIRERQEEMLESQQDATGSTSVRSDLLSSLIEANKGQSYDTKALMEEALSDSVLSLLFAGYETSSVTLTYALYLISQHPDVEAKCLEEIYQVEQSSAGTHDAEDDYPYLHAVLTETLRLYPPAISTTRALEKGLTLDGIPVPQGTYMYVPIWLIQRDDKNFHDPESFIPERWTRGEEMEEGRNHNPEAFVAFSAGARSCPGELFAMQEMTLVLSLILKNLRFEAREDYVLTPYRSGVVQEPKGGMPMIVTKRGKR